MTSPLIIQPGESLQRLQTGWTDQFTDQHGRRFEAHYDIRNMRPKEELRPIGFSPPWMPPMRYIVWDRDGSFSFRWDYETLANDLSESSTAHYAQVFEFMTEHMPGVEVPEVGEPLPTKVLRSPIGKAPLSPAIPLSCLAGDAWILGMPNAPVNAMLRDVLEQSATSNGRQALIIIRERLAKMVGGNAVPTREIPPDPALMKTKTITDFDLAQITGIKYIDFISAAMKGGMTMADAASAWKAHRENLALAEAS
jgi:hypothetical protein